MTAITQFLHENNLKISDINLPWATMKSASEKEVDRASCKVIKSIAAQCDMTAGELLDKLYAIEERRIQMKASYDYSELIAELNEDLQTPLLSLDSKIWIVRSDNSIFDGYFPIVDWYFLEDLKDSDIVKDKLSAAKLPLKKVLEEMNTWNSVI